MSLRNLSKAEIAVILYNLEIQEEDIMQEVKDGKKNGTIPFSKSKLSSVREQILACRHALARY